MHPHVWESLDSSCLCALSTSENFYPPNKRRFAFSTLRIAQHTAAFIAHALCIRRTSFTLFRACCFITTLTSQTKADKFPGTGRKIQPPMVSDLVFSYASCIPALTQQSIDFQIKIIEFFFLARRWAEIFFVSRFFFFVCTLLVVSYRSMADVAVGRTRFVGSLKRQESVSRRRRVGSAMLSLPGFAYN